MTKIKKILAPTDLSALSRDGVRHALEMAERDGAEVIVYNVVGLYEAIPYYGPEDGYVPDDVPTVAQFAEEHRMRLAKFVAENFAGAAKIHLEVAFGVPYQKIVEKAAAENADLIVMSTHGRTGLMHALIGSVAEKVVRLAACPVLTVRPKKEPGVDKAAA